MPMDWSLAFSWVAVPVAWCQCATDRDPEEDRSKDRISPHRPTPNYKNHFPRLLKELSHPLPHTTPQDFQSDSSSNYTQKDIREMVTGQLTRSEAEAALKRLQGLRDDWAKQRTRWSEHHQKAADIKALQRNPSAPLIYTVEACCNQMGVATIRFNELERLIQDFRSCALYLVHLPVPEGPDASFRSALPDLWSIPHAAPGTTAVALPGQVAGFSAEMVPVNSVQGLSDQIIMHHPSYQNAGSGGFYNNNQILGNLPQMQYPQQQQIQPTGFQQQPQLTGAFQAPQHTGFQPQSNFQLQAANNQMGFQQGHQLSPYGSQPQPLTPQHTQMLYNQQINLHQQSADQARVNAFSANVFQQQPGFSSAQNHPNQHQNFSSSSPLNPFNPNAPHGAVVDASQRYPAVQ
ncbi:hypothetical protein PGT21_036216 [Puccinia graminis f. sp. tritici]|uniref:Uncharacterized protein n=1 Tax=Puccinia graminis f. sp. tritici TaxID=56615 RepID=A0A5B0PN44_PUCGR|nr:hypothetical protein PGT21_036216 [Puccinia graminis f. sp. tritici]